MSIYHDMDVEERIRFRCLELALSATANAQIALTNAKAFEEYITGATDLTLLEDFSTWISNQEHIDIYYDAPEVVSLYLRGKSADGGD